MAKPTTQERTASSRRVRSRKVRIGGNSQIQIYKRAGGYRVRPATYAARQGATVTFFNAGPAAVRLLFPEEIFAGVGAAVDIGPSASTSLLVKGRIRPGAYPYAVYYIERSGEKDFAAGESAPVIIIDR